MNYYYHGADVEVQEGDCIDGLRMIRGTATSANILGFEAGTTGYRGGDSGHGGRTVFTIFDRSSSDIRATISRDGNALRVELGGDCELNTIIAVLKSIVLILENSAHGGTECTSAEQVKASIDGEREKSFAARKVKALEDIAESLRLKVHGCDRD